MLPEGRFVMQFDRETLRSPWVVFIIYVVVGSLFILGFRIIFPSEVSPLPVFARDWRIIRGLLDILALFPALAFSALVVPFGFVSDDDYYATFSPRLFQRLIPSLVTAFASAFLYALLFFLVLPLAQNHEENLRFRGETYRLAKERAQAHALAGEWLEASQLIGICDNAWYDSPEIADLRAEVTIQLENLRYGQSSEADDTIRSASVSALPGQREPLDAAEAISLAEAALSEGRLFDAHWLAIVGGRIARPGSPESTRAPQLAARAWNQIESIRPTGNEQRTYSQYQLKLSGYEAMVSGDWIRAFYIFQELLALTPFDPDAEQFFAASERGTREIAFFINEMELSPGETLTGVIFSLPSDTLRGGNQGRSVMRVASLSATPDYAYGVGIEYMVFDAEARLLFSLQAPYVKFLPITLDGQRQVLMLMRALDRHDSTKRWEPEWDAQGEISYYPATAQITLNIDYETFVTISEMRQRLPSLQFGELFTAAKLAGDTGYIPQVFEAEILNRLGTSLFFLPMSVIAIIIGWYFRARHRPRYFFVLLLPILPLVFNAMAYLYRAVLNTVGISLILSLGFSLALPVFIAILSFAFILSLILLAAQHGE
jgi:hypothetical protein